MSIVADYRRLETNAWQTQLLRKAQWIEKSQQFLNFAFLATPSIELRTGLARE
jgi:hypothetical protein